MSQLETYEAAMAVCDPLLRGHAARVAEHAEAVVRRLGWDENRIEALRLGAALHDVGKINLRPGLLDKPGRLDPGELEAIRVHPVEGAWLIAGVRSLEGALPYVLFHHERWDGHGYPTRRTGHHIPLEGRVLAVADAFDAMTSERPYRRALTREEALAEMERCSGAQFDPEIVEALLGAIENGETGAAVPASRERSLPVAGSPSGAGLQPGTAVPSTASALEVSRFSQAPVPSTAPS